MRRNPFDSPYTQPYPVRPQAVPTGTPGVIQWFKVYCVLMVLLYAVCCIAGICLISFATELASEDPQQNDPIHYTIMGGIFVVMSIALGFIYGVGIFLPRQKWGWIYGFFPICIGFTSVCTLVFCIPLLIFWLRADTKAYFGMS